MNVLAKFLPLFLIATLLVTVGQATAQTDQVAAVVNGSEISRDELDRSVANVLTQRKVDPASLAESEMTALQTRILNVLISKELLWQEAKAKGYQVSDQELNETLDNIKARYPDEQAYVADIEKRGLSEEAFANVVSQTLSVQQLVKESIMGSVSVTDEEIHDYYTANPDKFTIPEQVHTGHILIKVGSDADDATDAAARAKIDGILEQARGGADFAELAEQYSEGPSASKGGDLGFAGRGNFVKPYEEAAFALEVGQISPVVKTQFGYHIIKLEGRKGGAGSPRVAEFSVKPQIRKLLTEQAGQKALSDKVDELRAQGEVKILVPGLKG